MVESFAKKTKKAAAYFESADALYVSLKDEGYVGKTIPNKLVMSMAFAKPIIAVLGGDGRDVVLASKGGMVCDENKESIAKAINDMAALSPEERKKLGQLNQAYYHQHLSIERVGEQVNQALLEELL